MVDAYWLIGGFVQVAFQLYLAGHCIKCLCQSQADVLGLSLYQMRHALWLMALRLSVYFYPPYCTLQQQAIIEISILVRLTTWFLN